MTLTWRILSGSVTEWQNKLPEEHVYVNRDTMQLMQLCFI